MVFQKYSLSELHPIKAVIENELLLAGIEHSVKKFGFCVPLVITPDKKIVDGNSRWHVLTRIFDPKWSVLVVLLDIPESKIWQVHTLLNSPAVIPSDPVENLIKTASQTMKWKMLSKLNLSVTMGTRETTR